MKKIKTIFETMLFAAVVLVMAQGCIPTTPVGGNPTPTNTFGVYFSDEGVTTSINKYKLIVTGDDSIYFTFDFYNYFGTTSESLNIYFQSSTGSITEYLTDTTLAAIPTIPSGILVNNNMDNRYYNWVSTPTISLAAPYSNFNQKFYAFGSAPWAVGPFLKMPVLQDRYFVFRRLKGTNYNYYWIKVNATLGNGPGNFVITFSNGRCQMDSIITGQ
jgi:hypothetical protein